MRMVSEMTAAVMKQLRSKDKQKERNYPAHAKATKMRTKKHPIHNGSRVKKKENHKLNANDVLEISKHYSCSIAFNGIKM